MSAILALDDYPRHAPVPRCLRRVNGCATVTALGSSMIHPNESKGRIERVQRIIAWLDAEAPEGVKVSSKKVQKLTEYHWQQVAQCMEEPPISKTTQRQVVSYLQHRELDSQGGNQVAVGE